MSADEIEAVELEKAEGDGRAIGSTGSVMVGGYIVTEDREPKMAGDRRWIEYQRMMTDVSIIAAGLRAYLNLLGLSQWTVNAPEDEADDGRAQEIADAVYDMMFDHETPWARIIKKISLYRVLGFSIMEWVAKRRPDGLIGMLDVESRPQRSIARWEVDDSGTVTGVYQIVPNTGKEVYLPRDRLIYAVDDSLTDAPDGLGLLRQCLNPVTRLRGYKQLEEIGYEQNLHGIPIAHVPLSAIDETATTKGSAGAAWKNRMLAPIRNFLTGHTRNRKQGVMMESEPYRDSGENKSPSQTRKWELDVLTTEGGQQSELAKSIMREIQEIARILGVEHLLIGSEGAGSLALNKSKVGTFFLNVTSVQSELVEVLEADWLRPICENNGWPEELWPTLACAEVQDIDIEQITEALANLARAGVTLNVEDEATGEIFDRLGLTRPDPALVPEPLSPADLINPLDPGAPIPQPANDDLMPEPRAAGVVKWVMSERGKARAMQKRGRRGRG